MRWRSHATDFFTLSRSQLDQLFTHIFFRSSWSLTNFSTSVSNDWLNEYTYVLFDGCSMLLDGWKRISPTWVIFLCFISLRDSRFASPFFRSLLSRQSPSHPLLSSPFHPLILFLWHPPLVGSHALCWLNSPHSREGWRERSQLERNLQWATRQANRKISPMMLFFPSHWWRHVFGTSEVSNTNTVNDVFLV